MDPLQILTIMDILSGEEMEDQVDLGLLWRKTENTSRINCTVHIRVILIHTSRYSRFRNISKF